MYKLVFEKRALNDLNKIEENIKKRIWYKLNIAKEFPFRFFEKLVEVSSYKLRIGDYRIIADIFRDREVIIILKIGHRKKYL